MTQIEGEQKVSKKNVMGFFRAIFSTAFYVGLFGGISYLIKIALL
jgi:hypothetical protein